MDKDKELSKLKNLVFSDGNKDAKVMIVGEAPGRTEDKLQKPFVGRAGKLLDSLLESINLNRSKVYITNVVNFRPDKNRKPSVKEINLFKKFLFRHINIIKPNIILLLGATAAEAVLKHVGPLSKIRGKWKNIKIIQKNFNALVTFHPAFLLRQSLQKRFFLEDLKILKKKITNR